MGIWDDNGWYEYIVHINHKWDDMWSKQCHKPPMTGNGLYSLYQLLRWWLGNCLWHCFTHIMKNEETGWDHDNNNIGHYPVIILYITIMMQGDDLRNLLLIYTYVDWTWSKITGPLVLKCLKHCRISRYRDPNVDGKTVMCCSMYTFFPWQLCHTHTRAIAHRCFIMSWCFSVWVDVL